jgi:hypothetical protein
LLKGNWLFTHFRPGSDPFYALAKALIPLYTPNLNATERMAQTLKLADYLDKLTSCTWKYGCQNRDYVQEEPNVQYQVKVKTQVFLGR